MALYQTLQLEVRWFPVQKDHLNVDVFPVFVQEVLEKVADTFVGNVAANDNVSAQMVD